VNTLKHSGDILLELLNVEKHDDAMQELLERQIQVLRESPMSVSLLQASGVGKSVKKFVKACTKGQCSLDVSTERPIRGSQSSKNKPVMSPMSQLEQILQRWKDVAANSGVQINSDDRERAEDGKDLDDQEDLRLAESCQSWKDLFLVLQQREEERRASQGARMREIRKNLATGRPRVIKVRPTKSRYEKILDRAEQTKVASCSSITTTGGSTKIKALRKESAVAAKLQKSSAKPTPKAATSFGSAVAFASTTQASATKRKTGNVVSLAGGKEMKAPYSKVAKAPSFGSAVAFASTTQASATKRKTGNVVSLAGGKQMKAPYSKVAKGPTSFSKPRKPGQSRR
jgi:ribosomal protein L18